MDRGVVAPFPLTDRDESASLVYHPRDAGLAAASQYVNGDLVTTRSGSVAKEVEAATPGNIKSLAVAGQPWNLEPLDSSRYAAIFEKGVPLNVIRPYEAWVLTLAGALDQAALDAIAAGAQRDVLYDAEGALTIRATSGSPAVQLVGVFRGVLADTNAWVIAKWLPGVLL